uniref:WRC domain-containing protein n=2 Tax=Physcomitrium patens TaxID=3218 RepID=A0A7I4EDJ1_PHYPA
MRLFADARRNEFRCGIVEFWPKRQSSDAVSTWNRCSSRTWLALRNELVYTTGPSVLLEAYLDVWRKSVFIISAAVHGRYATLTDLTGFMLQQEHAHGTSLDRDASLEDDPEKNRVSADDDFNDQSAVQNTVETGSSADGHSRKRRASISAEVKLSISSIIRAGVAPVKTNSPTALVSAQSVVTSDLSLVKDRKDAKDSSPSIAMKTMDQHNLLLQSLKRVCSTAVNTGLTAKEAVAKIRELSLPGLNEGGERLIVQVAKAFRSSSAFIEREERGRYFVQDSSSLKEWENFNAEESSVNCEMAILREPTEAEKAEEAARQLQSLQRVQENIVDREGVTNRKEKNGLEGKLDHRIVTLRTKSGARASSSQKASLSRDQSGSRCNRDDGKGWRCFRPAEVGFSLCKYHRDQIRRAEIRRRKSRNKSKEQIPVKPLYPIPKDVKISSISEVDKSVDANMIESDDELPDIKRRKFVKAKSLKSIL